MELKAGDVAPTFQLVDEYNQVRRLSDYQGRRVAVYFYPKDDSRICTRQACSLRDGYKILQEKGIIILGISYDSPESHRKFKDKYHLPFTLLSDENRETARAYGAAGGLLGSLFPRRYTYLIDEDGKILDILRKVDAGDHAREILKMFNTASQSPKP